MIGLVPVAVFGWTWGVFSGAVGGILGLLAIEFRSGNLAPGEWLVTYTFPSERVFELLTFTGTGLAVAFLHRFRRTIIVERAVSRRAQVDPLTGALTRGAFDERLTATITKLQDTGQGLAVLFVDLDRFKFVNDTYGHEMGDRLLGEVGKVLRDNIRDNDFVGRVGGDEFTVALLGVKEERSAASIARGLVRELSSSFHIDGRDVQVSASIGIGLYPRDGHDPETLLRSADAAMYQVKEGGKNSFYFSTVEVRTRLSRRLQLERQLRTALQEHQREVAYQPQVHLADNRLSGFEALLRWQSPELGTVSPSEFIPVAEEAGLISPIGHWMLRETALQQREWLRAGLQPVRVAVNVSTMQFHQQSFLDTVKGALTDSGIPPELLEIEVTESVLVRDYELAMRTLHKLERLGVPTALDDFGTGYSSLAYLQRLPIRTLKIDRSFVQGLSPRPVDVALHPTATLTKGSTFDTDGHGLMKRSSAAWSEIASGLNTTTVDQASTLPIVEAICAMAHKLDKQVVAEGVETAYQRDFLRRLGVDLAQGYFFARPMKPADAEQLLRRVTRESETARRLRESMPPVVETDMRNGVSTHLTANREFDELLLHD